MHAVDDMRKIAGHFSYRFWSKMPSLFESLNPKQLEAVTLPQEHALILAGAGSGKTRVLTTRIAWLLNQSMARPSEILAVTFTNKAAREMRTRLETMIKCDINRMWVGTFHSIAHRLLRLHAAEANLPAGFQIIDQADQQSLVKRLMRECNLTVDHDEPKRMQSMINAMKERGLRAKDVTIADTNLPNGRELYQLYESRCQKEGLVDFAELLLRAYELLAHNETVRAHYAERFRYLLIDEFQDTNELQYRWIRILANPQSVRNTVFCVGDDDQSIYAFRGARVGNMDDFVRDYAVRHVVKLEQNYRSSSHILDAANAVIANNAHRMGKNLWTSAGAGQPVLIYEAANDRDEAQSIVQRILIEHRRGVPYRHFAVLYRNNVQSRLIEEMLNANMVPYRIYGGLRFFDRQEVKDLTAYLRAATFGDDTSVLRIINHPPRNIGAASLARMVDFAETKGTTLLQALPQIPIEDPVYSKARVFLTLIGKIRESLETLNLPAAVDAVITASGLESFYEAQRDRDIRLENMREVVNAAAGYLLENHIEDSFRALEKVPGAEMSPLEGFLSQATLESDDKNEQTLADAVQMMTVHMSKGLEFPSVFLCGLEEGLFPHAASMNQSQEKALSEERRLMYVAMTRAKSLLWISWCESRMLYGSMRSNIKSRFLEEIPQEHVEILISPHKERAYDDGESHGRRERFPGSSSHAWAPRKPRTAGTGVKVYRASDLLAQQIAKEQKAVEAAHANISKQNADKMNFYGIVVGDRVSHAKFGIGTVMAVYDMQSADIARARVKFNTGVKELMLRFAKLRKTA